MPELTNRISINIPGSSATAAAERDEAITKLKALGIVFDLYHYSDINSGNGIWGYYAVAYDYVDGLYSIAAVTCTGMTHPPSGSDLVAMPDPGPGAFVWASLGAPFSVKMSGDGSDDIVIPPQNPNYWVWPIAANAPTVVTDWNNAIQKCSQVANNFNYYKYVDATSGAWAVYAITEENNAAGGPPIFLMVTCAGTPHPPTGSMAPAVPMPAFTVPAGSFIPISCPLIFGPKR